MEIRNRTKTVSARNHGKESSNLQKRMKIPKDTFEPKGIYICSQKTAFCDEIVIL